MDTEIKKNLRIGKVRSGRWKYTATLLAVAVLAASWLIPTGSGANTENHFVTEPVRTGDLVVTVTATGQIEPRNQVEVGTEISGTIKTVTVDNNDIVKKGMVLAELDPSRTNTDIKQAEAALSLARSSLLKAKASTAEANLNYSRQKSAYDISEGAAISLNELDAAKAELQRARADENYALAQISQAKASLEEKRLDLEKHTITSPVNGVVLERDVDPGQTVAASMSTPTFFTLAEDLKNMELHVDLDEADVGQVREGQKATFTVDAFPDKSFDAEITKVRFSSQDTDNVVTYETICNVDNPDLLLRPGMTATAEIEVKRVSSVLLVPNAALRFTPPAVEKNSKGFSIGSLMPGPPRGGKDKNNGQKAGKGSSVWILRNGEPTRIQVGVKATDGIDTQIVSDKISDGDEVVLEMIEADK